MFFLFVLLILIVTELIYFRIANYFNIVDNPNDRSSHTDATIRGGGIIFWGAALIYYMYSGFSFFYFFLGLTIITLISFLDDVFTLSSQKRLPFQFLAIGLTLWEVHINAQPYWLFIGLLIIGVGILNAYNFMDGINGMTGGYSFVTLLSFWYINNFINFFIDNDFLYCIIASILVFNFFNFRTKARCFAGDVGSISIALLILFLLIKLVLRTNELGYIMFLTLYGIDSIGTIVFRLSRKENIFMAHRMHLFQLLVNRTKMSHLQVSLWYITLQLIINIVIIKLGIEHQLTYINIFIVLFISLIIYFLVRRRIFNILS